MRVRAFAKINLSLRVLGTRADGYHELRTIFQSIALHDTLTIRARRGPFQLTCDDPACPADETNLIWRAAERRVDARPGAAARRATSRSISSKRIPMQAGLGGGSSDAAAALRALGRAVARRRARRCARIAAAARRRRAVLSSRAARCSASSAAICCFRCRSRRPRGSCWCCPVRRQHEGGVRAGSTDDVRRGLGPTGRGRSRRRGTTSCVNDLRRRSSRTHPEIAPYSCRRCGGRARRRRRCRAAARPYSACFARVRRDACRAAARWRRRARRTLRDPNAQPRRRTRRLAAT